MCLLTGAFNAINLVAQSNYPAFFSILSGYEFAHPIETTLG